MAAIAAMSAATMAYRKAVKKTRDADGKNLPPWLKEFRDRMPEIGIGAEPEKEAKEDPYEVKKRELADSRDLYDQVAWFIYKHLTSKTWFEAFIMLNILLLGLATGLDLEYSEAGYKGTVAFVDFVGDFTVWVFTVECVLKLVAEAWRPERYFQDPANGAFNTFDFVIVVAGWTLASIGGGAIGALRMLRLVRLLTFVKGIKQLRVIVSGLLTGMKSVSYIVILLILIIYMFAILACLLFGANDPARFGTVAIAMLSLFQVSTLASWTSIAYTSWFGCSKYGGAPYDDSNPSMIFTPYGAFEGYRCDADSTSQLTVLMFFWLYIILTAWVIMSLFIGVITMGMFESFEEMKAEIKAQQYQDNVDKNNSEEESELSKMLRAALVEDPNKKVVIKTRSQIQFERLCEWCKKQRDSTWLTTIVTSTIITVGVLIGVETDQFLSCARYDNRDNRPPGIIERCEVTFASSFMEIASLVIFTCEALIKVLSYGYDPMRYLEDPWNCLDAFVVFTGFVELTPARVIFEIFPMVVLRLLRLLRVFRLAKALPRLRSIVEALMEGFTAVGWIVILIVVFNYIVGCMCMLFLKGNDPFHFGTISRAMFTVLRIETLDSWDQILQLNIRGCDAYPAAYDFTYRRGKGLGDVINLRCDDPNALGWLGALLMLVIVILGSFVLPTVLIGIVAISFEEATRKAANMQAVMASMDGIMEQVNAQLPGYFTEKKMAELKEVFEEMDADDELSLDMNEMIPFYNMAFNILFECKCPEEEMEGMFHLMDGDCSSELGFPEFVLFVATLKQVEASCQADPSIGKRMFAGMDSKFHKLEKKPTKIEETKDVEASALALQAMPEGTSEKLPSKSDASPKVNFDSAAVQQVADTVVGVAAAQYGKRARPAADPQMPLPQVVHTATASITECFLRQSVDNGTPEGGRIAGSPRLTKELSTRIYQALAGELTLQNAVTTAAPALTSEPVFGPPPNPRDLNGLVQATISLFINARAGKPGWDHTTPVPLPTLEPPGATFLPDQQLAALPPPPPPPRSSPGSPSLLPGSSAVVEPPPPPADKSALSPRSAGRFLDGSGRAAGAGRSTGKFLNQVGTSSTSSSVVDLAGSSAAAAAVASTDARYNSNIGIYGQRSSSRGSSNGRGAPPGSRPEIRRTTPPRRGPELKGASDPRGKQPSPKPAGSSFEERFQRERGLKAQSRSRAPPPPPPPTTTGGGSVGGGSGSYGSGSYGSGSTYKGTSTARVGGSRMGQELSGGSNRTELPPRATRSPSSSFGKRGSGSDGSNSSSPSQGYGGSGVVASRNSIQHTRGGHGTLPASSASAAAWQKVLALLATDNQAAIALEEMFERAPGGFLNVDKLSVSLFDSGVQLKGLELRAFQADCDLNGNGKLSLDQFLEAVQSQRRAAEEGANSGWNTRATTNTLHSSGRGSL